MCEECRQLLEDYRVINEKFRTVVYELADATRSHEMDTYNELWLQGFEFSKKSQDIRALLLSHLQSHS
jgi:hypothetical protein